MVKDKETIIAEIKAYIEARGGNYSDWYVGVTEDTEQRFKDHNVKADWICRGAESSTIARDIEKHFFSLGAKGAPGGGDKDAKIVYAYKITSDTKE